jgi:hypothetical protein
MNARTPDEVRALAASLPESERCGSPEHCPGWFIADAQHVASSNTEIQRCDDCNNARVAVLGEGAHLEDHDFEQLPEAQAALKAAREPAECSTCNGTLIRRMAVGECEVHPDGGCATTCLDCQE